MVMTSEDLHATAAAVGLLVALGLVSGTLTTIAGQGGGLFLVIVLGAFIGPHDALAITAPALLLGNLHRAFLYRRHVTWSIALRLIAGALPGALVGGSLAGRTSPLLIDAALVVLTAVAITRSILRARRKKAANAPDGPHASHAAPLSPRVLRFFPFAGVAIGFLTGTSGGAGVLVSPLLLACGLTGRVFVGTSAVIAAAIHGARVAAYAHSGLMRGDQVAPIVVLAIFIFVGNALGERLRRFVSDENGSRLELGTLVVCVAISLLGIAR